MKAKTPPRVSWLEETIGAVVFLVLLAIWAWGR